MVPAAIDEESHAGDVAAVKAMAGGIAGCVTTARVRFGEEESRNHS
ncbi:hypothetical protein ARZXY2_2127 [Arthrobacter sp. ZXY-2]|nr:hypothetical protein ARZXY2_2127 [Arthrobacter sp. ZXY-2]